MKYKDLVKFTSSSTMYHINVNWCDLEEHIKHIYSKDIYSVEFDPDFQRGHVWSTEDSIKYVEFKLKGGFGADHIFWNCAGWQEDYEGPYQLVDGLQRLTAVRKFLSDEIPAFGHYRSEFEGNIPSYCQFDWYVHNLRKKSDVLKWYLELNEGGIIHTDKEIERVRNLLDTELNKK